MLEYVPAALLHAMDTKHSFDVPNVHGLRLVVGIVSSSTLKSDSPEIDRIANAAREFGDVLPTEALALLARVHRKTLEYNLPHIRFFALFCFEMPLHSILHRFKHALSGLMAHRKSKRAAVAAAASAAAAAGEKKLFNIALDDGSAVLGPRADTASIRDDASWRVKELPECFKRFHDVICGASTQRLGLGV